jgi:hypothetical protein
MHKHFLRKILLQYAISVAVHLENKKKGTSRDELHADKYD